MLINSLITDKEIINKTQQKQMELIDVLLNFPHSFWKNQSKKVAFLVKFYVKSLFLVLDLETIGPVDNYFQIIHSSL